MADFWKRLRFKFASDEISDRAKARLDAASRELMDKLNLRLNPPLRPKEREFYSWEIDGICETSNGRPKHKD